LIFTLIYLLFRAGRVERDEGKDYGKDEGVRAYSLIVALIFTLIYLLFRAGRVERDEGKDYGEDEGGERIP
jgi:hypothetical protein